MKHGDQIIGVVFDAFENGEPYENLEFDVLAAMEEAVLEHLRAIGEDVRHAAVDLRLLDPETAYAEPEIDADGRVVLRMAVAAAMRPTGAARTNPARAQEDAANTLARLENLVQAILKRHRLPID